MDYDRDKLMHSTGTTAFETFSVIIPSLFYTILASLISVWLRKLFRNDFLQFTVEFIILVVPIVLQITVCVNFIREILILISILIVTLLWMLWKSQRGNVQLSALKVGDFLTNARSTINIISVMCILAVDFQIFPRRFAKTEQFGYSLMDVGVGLFIYSNGIVDGHKSKDLKNSLRSTIPLLILGMVRFITTSAVGYHVPITEYGVHWNFFITLLVTKIFVSLFLTKVRVEYIYINALLLLISHEVLLQSGLEKFVMSKTKRDTFITANKEGIVSATGYISLYLFSVYFGHILNVKFVKNKLRVSVKFVILSFVLLLTSVLLNNIFPVSRKLANSAYCCWILFIGILMTGLFFGSEILIKYWIRQQKIDCSPLIYRAINYNGLTFFLFSNLITGIINVLFDTLQVNAIFSLVIIFIYMFLNCIFVLILYRKQIKLKL